MNKVIAGIVIAMMSIATLSACASADETLKKYQNEITVEYRGEILHCVTSEYDRSATMSCDFERFYNENPELTK